MHYIGPVIPLSKLQWFVLVSRFEMSSSACGAFQWVPFLKPLLTEWLGVPADEYSQHNNKLHIATAKAKKSFRKGF
jgi:hypothetical protein